MSNRKREHIHLGFLNSRETKKPFTFKVNQLNNSGYATLIHGIIEQKERVNNLVSNTIVDYKIKVIL
ncbi:MAG: hypothetical protein M3Y25_02150 [Thermoproteota archaeon]|nr:hypothetical protein [Thermoproteota archaeon]